MKIRSVHADFSFKGFTWETNVIVIYIITYPGDPYPKNKKHSVL